MPPATLSQVLTAAALAFVAGCSVSPATPDRSSRVTGRILRDDGRPAAGARVELGVVRVARDREEMDVRAGATTGADGKFRLEVRGDSYASRLRATGDGGQSVSVHLALRERTRVPDLRLWSPAVSVDPAAGTAVRIRWSAAPYAGASYGVRRPSSAYPAVLDAAGRSIAVDPLHDGPGRYVLVAEAVAAKDGRRYGVHLEVPVDHAALEPRPARLLGCTAFDPTGRARSIAGCTETPGRDPRRTGPGFVTAWLAAPTPIAAVRVQGCGFFCELYVSDDGRRWRDLSTNDAGSRILDGGVRILSPTGPVTTRWVGVTSRLGSPFDGDTAPDVAREADGMPFRGLAVYPGQPAPGRAPDRTAYREQAPLRWGGEEARSGGGERLDRGDPLPRSALPAVLLILTALGVAAFLAQGRHTEGVGG